MAQLDVAIVGAGIVGLAHAWSAAERGHRVTLFERSRQASGASIRNFGMVWPIGQSAGELHQLALLSRQRWLALASKAGISVNPCGSIHLAHASDEWAVLEEFHSQSPQLGVDCTLLTASEVLVRTPAANPDGLVGGLFSPTELGVNPRVVVRQIPGWLSRQFGVRLCFETNVNSITTSEGTGSGVALKTSTGERFQFHRVIVCSGTDFQTLFPETFRQSGMRLCKLQMMKTRPQPDGWQSKAHLAGGLTLRHYGNFDVCPGLPALKRRIAAESPELDASGIHVMQAQNDAGEVILGDSHEYDSDIEPFDKAGIDELILREAKRIFRLPDWTISERWHGFYAKARSGPAFEAEPLPSVHVCTGLGGAGMTMSFGLAERAWQRWSTES